MNLLTVSSTCSDVALANVLSIVKNILSLIQIIGPILCIISLVLTFTKMMTSPDNKKLPKKVFNSIIALFILFFIPLIVNVTMGLLDDSTTISSCWKGASKNSSNSSYISTDDTNKNSILTDPSEYKSSGSSSTSSNASNTSTTSSTGTSSTTSNVVFIGDSRTVQMYAYLANNWSGANYSSGGVHNVSGDIFVAEGSQGLSWLKSTGISAAKSYFKSGTAIAILMGVNDLDNASSYVSYINSNVSSWTSNGSKLYYVSVTPCSGSYSYLNSKITTFNSNVKSGLSSSVKWIDAYSYLNSNGYTTTDGLHYDKSTSNKLYNYIKSNV